MPVSQFARILSSDVKPDALYAFISSCLCFSQPFRPRIETAEYMTLVGFPCFNSCWEGFSLSFWFGLGFFMIQFKKKKKKKKSLIVVCCFTERRYYCFALAHYESRWHGVHWSFFVCFFVVVFFYWCTWKIKWACVMISLNLARCGLAVCLSVSDKNSEH